MIIVTRQNEGIKPELKISQPINSILKLHDYCLGGKNILFQSKVENLSAFKSDDVKEIDLAKLTNSRFNEMLNQSNSELHYQGMAQFEERFQEVLVWRLDSIYQINISGLPVCYFDVGNEHVHVLNDKSFDERLNLEVLTGPALITLIAQLGTFCLHAGAVSTPYGNILIIGESGFGKSTLSADDGEFWQQLTDDISPIGVKDNRVLLENYPQLKLKNNIAIDTFPDQPTIDLIIRLDGTESNQVNFKKLNKTDALLQFVRHTVASKLFDANMLKVHNKFAFNVVSTIPMVTLSYPRDLSKIGELRESICDYLRVT